MLLALILAQALQPASPEGPIFSNPATLSRYAFFEAFPASGAGTFGACSTTPPTGAKGEVITVSRSTEAWCTKDDYSLAFLAANQARVMSGTGGTTPLMIFAEPAATNSFLNNRDLSQASTTKTSMTCAKTATGVDGVANSATRCTATGANGTALQALVIAAATRNTSLYIRRAVGTLEVDVTRDNGATWSNITASLTGTMKRVVSAEAIGCAYGNCIIVPAMTGGGANPTIGIRIVNSGDAVDIDLVQDEPGSYPSSPITVAGTPFTRVAESISVPSAQSIGCLSYSVMMTGFTGTYATGADSRIDGTHFYSSYIDANAADLGGAASCYAYSGAGTAAQTTVFVPPLGPTPIRCSLSPGVSMQTSMLGTPNTIATAASSQAFSTITLGGGISVLGGLIGAIKADPDRSKCTGGITHPTAIAWVGDSLTLGDAAAPSRPPAVLRGLKPSRTIYNLGINSQSVAGCAVGARGAIAARAKTLVMLCGVNDIAASTPAATVWAALQVPLNEAKAAGMTVIPVLLTPWAAAVTWSAPKQTETTALNVLIQAWCTANGATCVNTDSLGTGSPLSLTAGNNSGDGLHLSPAGGAALAALVAAANP
jgi:hypothetical protein